MEGELHSAERKVFESLNTPQSAVMPFLTVKTAPTEVSTKVSTDAELILQRPSAASLLEMASVTSWGSADDKDKLENVTDTKHVQLSCVWLPGIPFFRNAFTRGPIANHRVLGLLWGDEEVCGEAHHKHVKCFGVQSHLDVLQRQTSKRVGGLSAHQSGRWW